VNGQTRNPVQGAPRLGSGSRAGQSDTCTLRHAGSPANNSGAIQSQPLTPHQRSLGPKKADLRRLALGSADSPSCGLVWTRVALAAEVAA